MTVLARNWPRSSLRLAHEPLTREQIDALLRECLDDLHLMVDTFNIDEKSIEVRLGELINTA